MGDHLLCYPLLSLVIAAADWTIPPATGGPQEQPGAGGDSLDAGQDDMGLETDVVIASLPLTTSRDTIHGLCSGDRALF